MSLAEQLDSSLRYQPFGSVWYGEEDAELLERLLSFYPRKPPERILDATVNGGRFWRGTRRKVIGLDIDPRHQPAVCGDNAVMPFRSGCFEVVVYDPPIFRTKAAIGQRTSILDLDSVTGLRKSMATALRTPILLSWRRPIAS